MCVLAFQDDRDDAGSCGVVALEGKLVHARYQATCCFTGRTSADHPRVGAVSRTSICDLFVQSHLSSSQVQSSFCEESLTIDLSRRASPSAHHIPPSGHPEAVAVKV
jgi:hypothetical protein